jgi:hypothetical protein
MPEINLNISLPGSKRHEDAARDRRTIELLAQYDNILAIPDEVTRLEAGIVWLRCMESGDALLFNEGLEARRKARGELPPVLAAKFEPEAEDILFFDDEEG